MAVVVHLCTVAAVRMPGPALGSAPEPYSPVHGGGFTGPPAPLSPDPMVRYVWPGIDGGGVPVDPSKLQAYTVGPVNISVLAGMVSNPAALLGPTPSDAAITVAADAPVSILFDFGVELPAWLEIDSPSLAASLPGLNVVLGVGEYSSAWQSGASSSQHKKGEEVGI